jgi:hypothetical protein
LPHILQNQLFIKYLAPSFPTHQSSGHLPGSDWQVDFTNMPLLKHTRYLLDFIDTLTRWIEAFHTTNKRASTWKPPYFSGKSSPILVYPYHCNQTAGQNLLLPSINN